MDSDELVGVLQGAVFTEKSNALASSHNQFVFKVAKSATKEKIARAVSFFFSVEVEKVRVLNRKGRVRRFGKTIGRSSDSKRAVVSLKEGSTLDLVKGG